MKRNLVSALLLAAACGPLLSGQVVTIPSTDTLSASLPKLNYNFAYLDASKSAFLSGSGAPGGGTGHNGDFYLDFSVNCLYGPKASGAWPGSCNSLSGGGAPNFTVTSGNATMGVAYVATGLTQATVEGTCALPSSGNFQAANCIANWFGGLFNPGNYGNLAGFQYQNTFLNGHNSIDNSDKKTMFGVGNIAYFLGGGQKFAMANGVTCPAVGDCYTVSNVSEYSGYNTAFGDEGVSGTSDFITQAENLVQVPTTGLTKSTCAASVITQAVAKSGNPTDVKTVTVDSSTNCAAGDWLTVDYGPVGTGDTNEEVIHLTAAGGGTIAALFQSAHSINAPVLPSPVLTAAPSDLNNCVRSGNCWAQGKWVVDLTATPYTTGTIAAVSGQNVTGSGTTWTTGMVGGDATLPGCIAFTADNFTGGPFTGGNSPLVSWFPIQSVTDNTHLVLGAGYTGVAPTGSAAYVVAGCGRQFANQVTYGPTSDTITGIVLEANNFPWTVGHTVEATISPNTQFQHGHQISWIGYGPHGNTPDMYKSLNIGYQQAHSGFRISGGLGATGYQYGFLADAEVADGFLVATGRSHNGVAVSLETFNNGVRDPKAINWGAGTGVVGEGGTIFEDVENGGLGIGQSQGKLSLVENGEANASGVVLDFSAPITAADRVNIAFPNVSGTVNVIGPGPLQRTIPDSTGSNNSVDIGTFAGGGSGLGTYEINIYTCCTYFRAKHYRLSFNGTTGSGWYAVPPADDTASSTDDYALDVSPTGLTLRLRRTAGSDTGSVAYMTIYHYGYPTGTFTPSTSVTTSGSVTQVWPTAVITQAANTVIQTNATGYTLTDDPTNLTANRTATHPNWSGTYGMDGGSTFTVSGCSAGTLVGGATVGSYVSGTTGTCAVTVTMGDSRAAAHGWACSVHDLTTPADIQGVTATNTTTVTFSGTTLTSDVVQFECRPY